MNLNEALSSAKDMFTIPDEVMGNIQAPTKYIAYSKSKQITSIKEVLEIAKQKLGRGEG